MKITLKELFDFDKETGLVESGLIKVNTPDGYNNILAVDITLKNAIKLIISTDNFCIVVSMDHLLYSYGWVKSKLLKIGDFIDTINGYEKIISIKEDVVKEDLYDIQVSNNEYYANGIRSHNSTIRQTIELCVFGKVQGKSGKKMALTKLPNRRNGALYTGIYFKNNNNDDVVMKRYIQPNDFEMTVNGEPYTERFKIMSPKEKEKIIGYSYEIFKSFISLNMNDFKNFISLSKEDKENLLNKLFNLSELDTLYSITKDLDNNNQKLINELDNLIYKNDLDILDYQETIKKIQINKKVSKDDRLNELKEIIGAKKPIYDELEANIAACEEEKSKLNIKYSKLNKIRAEKEREKTKLEVELELLQDKINLYNSGICPTCDTHLIDDIHKKHLMIIREQLEQKNTLILNCDMYLEKCILEDAKISNANSTIYNNKAKYQEQISDLKSELSILKKEYSSLKNTPDDNTLDTILDKITNLKKINKEKREIILELNKKSDNYTELKNIFSVDGIRKSLIKNSLVPINKYLSYFLDKLNSPYNAILNDDFDANIYELNILEIDPETLSKGEDKKINIAIALSYLKMILELKHTNIIFFDEIFDGVDVNNIEVILKLLKEIATQHKINIIIVNHGMEQIVDISIFDKIISVKKNIFSNLEIIDNQ